MKRGELVESGGRSREDRASHIEAVAWKQGQGADRLPGPSSH